MTSDSEGKFPGFDSTVRTSEDRHSADEEVRLAMEIEVAEAEIARAITSCPEALAELGLVGGEIEAGRMRARDALRDGESRAVPEPRGCPRLTSALRSAARAAVSAAARDALGDALVKLRLHRRVLDRATAAMDPASAAAIAARAAQTRADQCKSALVAGNLHVVVAIARRFRRGNVDLADLVQEGCIGLLRAGDKFNPRRGHRFSAYAGFWVRQQIARAMVEHSASIRVPLEVIDARQRLARTTRVFTTKHGREPTMTELTDASGLPAKLVSTVRELARDPISLHDVGGERSTELMSTIADDRVARQDVALDRERMRARMHALLERLPPREATIVTLRFGLHDTKELSLREVAERLDLSRERVRRIEVRALQKLAVLSQEGELRGFLAA